MDFQYFLIDVNRYSNEDLLDLSNLIGSVFYLEQTGSIQELLQKMNTLVKSVGELSEEEFTIFSTWVRGILKWRLPQDSRQAIEELATSMDRKGMVDMVSNIELILDEWKKEQFKEGIAEGIEEGAQRVAKEMLLAGMPLEQIIRFTKISREKLEQLQKDTH